MIKRLVDLFPVWAILFSIVAYCSPHLFFGFKSAIVPLLGIVMFGMGATLSLSDFKRMSSQTKVMALGVILQFLLMPFFGWLIARLFQLPQALATGLILVGSCPGGTASNVICYLAKGDVALSICLTALSTFLAVILTPLLTWLYIGQMVYVPVMQMLFSILKIVIIPVLIGLAVNRYYHQTVRRYESVFPLLSVAAIVLIIAIIVAYNRSQIESVGMPVVLTVILHNLLGLGAGYGIAKAVSRNEITARTIGIEVGMQNSGLGVALAVKYFSTLAALPGALFSIWHNLSGALLAWYWRKKGVDDETHCE
ncbi:MAG: bile acid:sodium symporter [Candidatus Omnitrophica bacterium CG11_big_fil_rev_8_21_14_0_20_45_26]|uniref:Bile acid:sodium symporter n=1 Tax=Candidatus Abzuiibacterium crystallinum TaxID=1974748 RepID=A0A2H0LMR0_9BACT|nr:MAG: bile acid:sodium symporter [Candidatus Omnitrophica bacterium CG11_big_fil_rev_8_21_14_0_20_45_26]PIW65182.1 MAG: bile acid:sodium symporter [Candidatus Omnitrophica bacterium CG12_big_fil_rev_8_21_14_0_65_45_16]